MTSRLEQAAHTVNIIPEPRPEMLMMMKNAYAMIFRTYIRFTWELIVTADDIKVIFRIGGGFDNFDAPAAPYNGVFVTSNLGDDTIRVCEHVIAMIPASAR